MLKEVDLVVAPRESNGESPVAVVVSKLLLLRRAEAQDPVKVTNKGCVHEAKVFCVKTFPTQLFPEQRRERKPDVRFCPYRDSDDSSKELKVREVFGVFRGGGGAVYCFPRWRIALSTDLVSR